MSFSLRTHGFSCSNLASVFSATEHSYAIFSILASSFLISETLLSLAFSSLERASIFSLISVVTDCCWRQSCFIFSRLSVRVLLIA